MSRFMRFATLAALVVLLCGCKVMALRSMHADMPTNLVERYAASTKPYADKTIIWLPFLVSGSGRVWKTDSGFSAEESGGLGPLLSLFSKDEWASWDSRGNLKRYHRSKSILWGILSRTSYRAKYTDEGTSVSYSRDFLFGSFGYESLSGGRTFLTLLWIPFQISGPDAG